MEQRKRQFGSRTCSRKLATLDSQIATSTPAAHLAEPCWKYEGLAAPIPVSMLWPHDQITQVPHRAACGCAQFCFIICSKPARLIILSGDVECVWSMSIICMCKRTSAHM